MLSGKTYLEQEKNGLASLFIVSIVMRNFSKVIIPIWELTNNIKQDLRKAS